MVRLSIIVSVLAVALSACCGIKTPEPVAAAAPPPAAPQLVTKEFVIYFGFDKHNLTDAGSELVAEIADYTASLDGGSVSLRGHTDSSGSGAYNDALSARRANTVESALSSRGTSVSSATSAGENELAVQTADGVREPLNRRVNVTVSGYPKG